MLPKIIHGSNSPVNSGRSYLRARRADLAAPPAPLPPRSNQGGNSEFGAARVGSVSVDWLTLTTFDEVLYARAVSVLVALGASGVPARQRGYEGVRGNHFFYGVGSQVPAGCLVLKEHYLLQVSGGAAHTFLSAALARGLPLERFVCTRIDVQYTHTDPVPDRFCMRAFADVLRHGEWRNGARAPAVTLIDSSVGLHTCYIGSRSSPRMQRVYIKDVEGSRLLRWETEYKGQLSRSLWANLVESGLRVLANVLVGELSALPVSAGDCLPPSIWAALSALSDDVDRLRVVRAVPEAVRSYNWLVRSVVPTVGRLAGGDSVGQELAIKFVNEVLAVLEAYLGGGVCFSGS